MVSHIDKAKSWQMFFPVNGTGWEWGRYILEGTRVVVVLGMAFYV